MKKCVVIMCMLICALCGPLAAQELYQEGRGLHLDVLNLSVGHDNSRFASFTLSATVRHRVTNKLDVGLLLDYNYSARYYYVNFNRNWLTFGPVAGYTHMLSESGWGVRATMGLRISFSDFSEVNDTQLLVEKGSLALAGYGADFTASLFKQIHISSAIDMFPGIGIFANASHLTGKRRDAYAIENFWGTHITWPDSLGQRGDFFNGGAFIRLPVSIKVFGHNRLAIEPYYIVNFKDIVPGLDDKFGILFRFSF